MSNGWEWEDFEQALNKTANDPASGGYDYNEDGTVGADDWAGYLMSQQESESPVDQGLGGFDGYGSELPGADQGLGTFEGDNIVEDFRPLGIDNRPKAGPRRGRVPPHMRLLAGTEPISSGGFLDPFEFPTAEPTVDYANVTVPGIPGIGSLPGSGYDPMDNLPAPDEEAEPTPLTPYEQYEAAANKTSSDPLSAGWDLNNDGTVGADDWGLYLEDPSLLPSPDWSPAEIEASQALSQQEIAAGAGLGGFEDPSWTPGETGALTEEEVQSLLYPGDWYGADPALAGAAGTFTGDMSRDDLESKAYLFGDAIVPPGYEKIFGEIERDPFREDWSEGRFRPYSYDIDLDDPKFDQYEPASNFLSDIWNSAEAAGFDSIENYLLDLQLNEDPNFERERDLYNYYAPIYEDLAPAYQEAKREAFQESLRGQGTQDWLESETGADYMTQALGIFATAMGIDAADISSEIIEMLVGAATSGRLADFIDNYGIEGGETFSQLVSREVNLMAAEMGMTVSDVMATPVLLQGIMASVTASMGATTTTQSSPIPEDGWKVGDVDPQTGLVYQEDETFARPPNTEGMTWNVSSNSWGTPSSGDQFGPGAFFENNDFSEGYEFLTDMGYPVIQATGASVTDGAMAQGLSFGNFDNVYTFGTHISGDNPIMGLKPESFGGEAQDWSSVLAGDNVMSLTGWSSDSATAGGMSQGMSQYPAFLINAINNQSPALMQASGGDPFSWWDSLQEETKAAFFTAYDPDKTMIEIANPTADISIKNNEGMITDYLMPKWFAEDMDRNGIPIDHKAWTHLSVEKRAKLQAEAEGFYGSGEGKLDLISSVRTGEDGGMEYLSTFNVDGEPIYGEVGEVQDLNLTRDPVQKLTTAEFMKVLSDPASQGKGWNILDVYSDERKVQEHSQRDLYGRAFSMSDIGKASVGNDEHVNWFQEHGGSPWDNDRGDQFTGLQSDLVPAVILEYIANNLDTYLDLLHGGDAGDVKTGAFLSADIDGDMRFDAGIENTETNGAHVLAQLIGPGFSDNFMPETFGELDVNTQIDWDDFFLATGEGGELGWINIVESNPALNENAAALGMVSEYSPDDDPFRSEKRGAWTNVITAMGPGMPGIDEYMARIAPLYQAYSNYVNSGVESADAGDRSVFEKQWTEHYKNSRGYDNLVNLEQKMEMEKEIARDVSDLWLAEWQRAGFVDTMGGALEAFEDRGGQFGLIDSGPQWTVQPYSQPAPTRMLSEGGSVYAQGGYVDGSSGGMDDMVPAVTDGMEPAKLSSGEFVIPADVVSHLGDGNNDNGASKLHDMMNRIRTFKTGNAQQPAPVDDTWVMPG